MKRWTATVCVIAGLSTLGATGCLETGQIDELLAIARDAVDAAGELGLSDPNTAPRDSEGGYATDPNTSGEYGDSSDYGDPNSGYSDPNSNYGDPHSGYGDGYGDPNSGYSDPNSGDGWGDGAYEWPSDPNSGWSEDDSTQDDPAPPDSDSHSGGDNGSNGDSWDGGAGDDAKK